MWWMLYIAIKTVDVDQLLVVPGPFGSLEKCEQEMNWRAARTAPYSGSGKTTVEFSCRPVINMGGYSE